MSAVVVTLPDGSKRNYDAPVTGAQVAAELGRRLEKDAIAAVVNGKLVDINTPLTANTDLAIITRQSNEGLEILRHSTAHLLAHAIKELWPNAQITIGPVIDDGFYYDIDCPVQISPEDLLTIEKKMTEIAARNLEVTREMKPRDQAIKYFKSIHENFKAEIISDLSDESVSLYTQGDFTDLCRGPHVPNTSKLGKFKLLSVAGAYWRGNENNPMLQRIYGTAWPTQKELDTHLERLEEAKRRDHRKVGQEMELFSFQQVAPAMPFYLPKGAKLYNILTDFMRAETEALGYEEVACPQIMNSVLWEKSGHLEHYGDNMFVITGKDDQSMAIKPMNCPGHVLLYGSKKHSYKQLPIRFSEYTRLYRNERAGVTHGLFRTRSFCQDDGHIFCREDQLKAESQSVIEHVQKIYRVFGFTEIGIKLATRPEKFLGTPENWDKATKALEESLVDAGLEFTIAKGEGAFYGPKIEFHIRDCLARDWQCGTVQVDFNLPERFELEFTDSSSQAQRPVMIHRAVLGSFERFLGILIEHHNGHLPLWVCPVQATIINVTSDQEAYTQETAATLRKAGIRVEVDMRNEKLGYRIREAQLKKTPLMIILGNKESDSKTLSVRHWSGETKNDLSVEAFLDYFKSINQLPEE